MNISGILMAKKLILFPLDPEFHHLASTTCWMTGITGNAVVSISAHTLVFFVHVGFIVFMAVNATENAIVGRIDMAITAKVPLTRMFP